MANTREINRTDLVLNDSIQYIKPTTVLLSFRGGRSSTKFNVFFSDDLVNHHCRQINGSPDTAELFTSEGSNLITDSAGNASVFLHIPGGTYHPGVHSIVITDTSSTADIGTSVTIGYAIAAFNAHGTASLVSETEKVTTNFCCRETSIQREDLIAQSFFTYGKPSGIFLSSIEVYFRTKDDYLPIQCEIRSMKNGTPSVSPANKMEQVSFLNPSEVSISSDASLPSKFTFSPPIFLRGDSDFCFVLKSNSNKYSVFTSFLGEPSIENGKRIHEQPYSGALYRLNNNQNWISHNFEDIKFKMNIAKFDTKTQGNLAFNLRVPFVGVGGDAFRTIKDTNLIEYTHPHSHGLEKGDLIKIVTHESQRNITKQGIRVGDLNGVFTVHRVINDRRLIFQLLMTTTAATGFGSFETGDSITEVKVHDGGLQYQPSDTITFSSPETGTIAKGTLEIDETTGRIVGVNITQSGSGYSPDASITINTSTGFGAILEPLTFLSFSVHCNTRMNGLIPQFNLKTYGQSSTGCVLHPIIGNYEGGNLRSYTAGSSVRLSPLSKYPNLGQNLLIASSPNNPEGDRDTSVIVTMDSSNEEVSPVFSFKTRPFIDVYNYYVNSQDSLINKENRDSMNSSGVVDSIELISQGTEVFSSNKTILIDPPDDPSGTQATAIYQASGTIVITNEGSGYVRTPRAWIDGSPGYIFDVTISGPDDTGFNSEILPKSGFAKSKYITKKLSLKIESTGVHVLCTLSSMSGSYVDWYIRPSLSSFNNDYESIHWQKLHCDDARNKSSKDREFFEYKFYLDEIDYFDTYQLKAVLGSDNPIRIPIIQKYRAIFLA